MPLLWAGILHRTAAAVYGPPRAAGGPPTMAHLSSPLDHGMSPFGTTQTSRSRPDRSVRGGKAVKVTPRLKWCD